MATLVLQAAGTMLGGLLGPVGAAIGSAAGAMGGYIVDRALINSTQHHHGPRMQAMRPFTSEEGAPLARVFGTARIGGTLIWATRFEEVAKSERQGFKGGAKLTTYNYFANAAFALCEGPIAGVRRIWADGREIDLSEVDIRVYPGNDSQARDPLIEAKQSEGNAPAYRGTAYVVIDRFPIDDYGNRLPQFQFEVLKPGGDLHERIRAVALIPGSTEWGLATDQVSRSPRRGETEVLNRHVLHAATDLDASLDELAALCPNLVNVALVVTWFGDDLRAGNCRIRPARSDDSEMEHSHTWRVSGFDRTTAPVVSSWEGRAAYGGTPDDASVLQAIAAIHARGWQVTLYPFLMLDIPGDNDRPDPYGGANQDAYPWRGLLTCDPAAGRPASADGTAAAREQVGAFVGAATAADFVPATATVNYAGPEDDCGYRRMVLHYAHLAALAGGVDGFLVGSELRGLTTLRDEDARFPFVETLIDLAASVRAILGEGTRITYGADWSEYFGYQPDNGTGDVFYHLDPLWAHPAIDAVGIDNYMPLSDWRDEDHDGGNPDGFTGPYDLAALRGGIAGGEGYDWYYADDDARAARARSPITDGLAGKPWVFRYKDLRSWWSNLHHDRVDGAEAAEASPWVPRSKPLWFTELGCAAVDKGPNQPNVFPDPKSASSGRPHFSNGGRSDLAQRRFLDAHLGHWSAAAPAFSDADNPESDVYAGRMVDADRIYLWAWDARPFPAFPLDRSAWRDGDNWTRGHWLNGRLSGAATSDVVGALFGEAGLEDANSIDADGFLPGYILDQPMSHRAAVEPLIDLFGLTVADEGSSFIVRGHPAGAELAIADVLASDEEPSFEVVRQSQGDAPTELELAFRDPMIAYQAGQARVVGPETAGSRASLSFPGTIETSQAEALASDWLSRRRSERQSISFAVPASERQLRPGSIVTLPREDGRRWLVRAVEDGVWRRVEAVSFEHRVPAKDEGLLPAAVGSAGAFVPGKPFALLLDLPMLTERPPEEQLRIAATAWPWQAQQVFASPEAAGFELRASAASPARVGQLLAPLGPGVSGRLDHTAAIDVALPRGELASVTALRVLNGDNAAAVRSLTGAWEIVQFTSAEETAPAAWRLRGLLRGQSGTEDAAGAGAAAGADVVFLDAAVIPAGLRASEIGLALNWRVGPAGRTLSPLYFQELTAAGGVRSLLPLSPVHVRSSMQVDGSLEVRWIRRGRIGADSWLGPEVPLGEATELYVVDVVADGVTVRSATVTTPTWTYSAADIAADFAETPAAIDVVVRQISERAGAGLPARLTHSF